MDISILEDLGLTPSEIKTYTALLQLGSTTAGSVIEKSGLQNSVIHLALNSLIEKGLINYILDGKIKVYQATNPENFINYIDDKKKRFEQLLPELKRLQTQQKEKSNASIYKGVRGIKEAYEIMINSEGKEYLTFGGGPPTEKLMGLTFWLNLHEKRVANKLSSRQVFDESVRNIGGTEIQKKKLTNIRYLSKEFAQFQETIIVGNKIAICVFAENPYAFLVDDKSVAEGYKKYFELLWKIAKK